MYFVKITVTCGEHTANVTDWDNDYAFAGLISPDDSPEITTVISAMRAAIRGLAEYANSIDLTLTRDITILLDGEEATRTLTFKAQG